MNTKITPTITGYCQCGASQTGIMFAGLECKFCGQELWKPEDTVQDLTPMKVEQYHKMRKVTIYRATSRELLLGFKMGLNYNFVLQRPLLRKKDTDGYYTLVVYQRIHAYHIHGEDEYKSIRLVSGTEGRMEERDLTREEFRTMMQIIQESTGPDTLDFLDLPAHTLGALSTINGITSVCRLLEYTKKELQAMPNIGKKTIEAIEVALAEKKMRLNPF